MDYSHIITRQEDEVLWVTLNRPDKLNALNPELIGDLRTLFTDLYWKRDARIVILQGAGKAFCAGLDLAGLALSDTVEGSMDGQRGVSEIVMAMRRCPQPIITLMNGVASGGGFALALASDIRIATPHARMNAAFIKLGVSACDIGVSYFLPRMVGMSIASEYMLTGRFLSPERAYALGLVSNIVEPEALEDEARSLIADMRYATPLGLRLSKDALNFAIDAPSLDAAIAMEDRNQVLSIRDPNFKEGIRAFFEKRAPDYRN